MGPSCVVSDSLAELLGPLGDLQYGLVVVRVGDDHVSRYTIDENDRLENPFHAGVCGHGTSEI